MSVEVLQGELVDERVTYWADRVRPHLQRSVQGIIDAGTEMAAAAADLGGLSELAGVLGISKATASKFVRIAQNEALVSHGKQLPPSWTTLYELAQVPAEQLEEAIGSGAVRPDMERADAAKLAARFLNKPPARITPPTAAAPAVDDRLAREAIEKASKFGTSQFVKQVAKTALARSKGEGELADATAMVTTAQYLHAQSENRRSSQQLRNTAAQLLTDLAQDRVEPEAARDRFAAALDAELNNPDVPGSFEHAARQQDSSSTPGSAARVEDEGAPLPRRRGAPADQGPSPSAPRHGDVEAVDAAAQSDDEAGPSSSPSSQKGADVEPVAGDDDASDPAGAPAPIPGAPAEIDAGAGVQAPTPPASAPVPASCTECGDPLEVNQDTTELCEVCAGNLADIEAGPSEVTDEEPEPTGYAGAQGFVPGVHDRHGGASSAPAGPDPLRVAGSQIFDILTEIEGEVPDGSSPRYVLAAFINGRSEEDREEDRQQIAWWIGELQGALFLTGGPVKVR